MAGLLCSPELGGHVRPLASLGISHPGLGHKQLGAHRPVERRGAGRVVGQIFGAHHHLAVADLAQRARILRLDSHRLRPFLGQSGVVEDQHPARRRVDGQQALDARLIQGCRIPGRIGQQVLQAFGRGSGDCRRDGLCGLVRQVGEQTGEVALHTVAAGVPPEQRRKRF